MAERVISVEVTTSLSVPEARIATLRLLHALDHAGDAVARQLLEIVTRPGNAWDAPAIELQQEEDLFGGRES